MSKRALILWACVGILFLSAAKVTVLSPQENVALLLSSTEATPPSQPPDQGLLRAAYGPSHPSLGFRAVPGTIKESTLWLARAVYSETKLPHEQELVAWVV